MKRLLLIFAPLLLFAAACSSSGRGSYDPALSIPAPYVTVLGAEFYTAENGGIVRGEETVLDGGDHGIYVQGITGYKDKIYFLYSADNEQNKMFRRVGSVKPGEEPELGLYGDILAPDGYLINSLGVIRVADGVLVISGDHYAGPAAAIELSSGEGHVYLPGADDYPYPFLLYRGSEVIARRDEAPGNYLCAYDAHELAKGNASFRRISGTQTAEYDGAGILCAAVTAEGAVYYAASSSPGTWGIYPADGETDAARPVFETPDMIISLSFRGDRLFFGSGGSIYFLENGSAEYFCAAEKGFPSFFALNRLYVSRNEYIDT